MCLLKKIIIYMNSIRIKSKNIKLYKSNNINVTG